MKLAADKDGCRLYQGDARQYQDGFCGDSIDLILTNPYAPLHESLHAKPMIVSSFADRKGQMEEFCCNALTEIGRWGVGGRQAVWVTNLPRVPEMGLPDLSFIGEEMFEVGRGWWSLDLPLILLKHYMYEAPRTGLDPYYAMTVFDPFMGRGTTGKACQLHHCRFVGIDIDPERVELAKRYLEMV